MTVAELMKQLKEMPPDSHVYYDAEYGPYEVLAVEYATGCINPAIPMKITLLTDKNDDEGG
jgi:hypothetical protein